MRRNVIVRSARREGRRVGEEMSKFWWAFSKKQVRGIDFGTLYRDGTFRNMPVFRSDMLEPGQWLLVVNFPVHLGDGQIWTARKGCIIKGFDDMVTKEMVKPWLKVRGRIKWVRKEG